MTEARPSGVAEGEVELRITGEGTQRRLEVLAPIGVDISGFAGSREQIEDRMLVSGALSHDNAVAVRSHAPWLSPRPIGLTTSAGTGDRLGMATPGHARAFQHHGRGVSAVFAQQSIREMDRLGRSPQSVLDDATFGAVEAGWTEPVGADADHLQTLADIDRCIAAGFTTFTIDPGEHVRAPHDGGASLESLPWAELEDSERAFLDRYIGSSTDGDAPLPPPSESEVRHAAAKYAYAVAHTVRMYRHLVEHATGTFEVEVSVDETDDVTTPFEHVYLARELRRLGVEWVSFAPRYVGRFEKGIEYIGDLDVLTSSLATHHAISRAYGPYKLSLHSGSDKFSIYRLAAEVTGGEVHLKTSGTSYLVALEVAAERDPELFRSIYRISRDAYAGTRASYQVSAALQDAPPPETVPDSDLAALLTNPGTRQILHVGYGAVLGNGIGEHPTGPALRAVLETGAGRYSDLLEVHLGRHLELLRAT